MKIRIVLPLFITLVFTNCTTTPTPKELIKENKTQAEQQFERFYACYDIAKTAPAIENDNINWETNDVKVKYRESNVYQIGIESFKDLTQPLDVPFDGTRRREHADMAQLFEIDLSDHKQPHDYAVDYKYSYHEVEDEDVCAAAIQHFLAVKYLLINRIQLVERAGLIDEKTYTSGLVTGDVLVFDVEKTKLLGGFTIRAENKNNMQIGEYSDINSNLDADLGSRAYGLTVEKFAALTPTIEKASFNF